MKYDMVYVPDEKGTHYITRLETGRTVLSSRIAKPLSNVHVFTEDEFNALRSLNIYEEKTVGDKWCYKCQPKGEQIIIVVDEDKEVCYGKLLIELHNRNILKLKSLQTKE